MKHWILFMCFFLAAGVVRGQLDSVSLMTEDTEFASESVSVESKDPSTVPATREYASERIERRKFDQKRWQEIIEARNYTDTRTRKDSKDGKSEGMAPGERSGTRAQQSDEDDGRYDYEAEDDSGLNISWLGPLSSIIFYGAIIAIIVVILMQIVRNTSFKFNPKRAPTPLQNTEEIHDISELDTEALIAQAQRANDYKLAIRLYFLDLLKRLNANGVIVWTKDKTNRDYLSELFSKQYYFDEVRKLTLAYERVWYGEHIPTEERFRELTSEFLAINQKFKAS